MHPIGKKKAFRYKKPVGSDSSVGVAIFDLEKCTFKIVIRNAVIGLQTVPTEFGISFGDFNETVFVTLKGSLTMP